MAALPRPRAVCALVVALVASSGALAAVIVENPYLGVTHITRSEVVPRPVNMHIVQVNLNAPGINVGVTTPGGARETVRQRTADFLTQEHAQIAVNGHFFLPFPSNDTDAFLVGFAAHAGNTYSAFEAPPVQNYALVSNSPAINFDPTQHASFVTRNLADPTGLTVNEGVTVFNALSGSAQVITNGASSVPEYVDPTHPNGQLVGPGPAGYSNSNSWYNLARGRTVMGLSQDNSMLTIFTVDQAGGSQGMTLFEIADLLRTQYGVWNAINLDGGGSTSLAFADGGGVGHLVNVSADSPLGRAVGSNFAIFASPVPAPGTGLTLLGVFAVAARRRPLIAAPVPD